ncbi:hypothetical protein M413DRAFT_271754 [Hebeloma cylindrosporum]|uniref:Uncharacterized protein n=1 Tax=Hebeloma cylindrosporum TaxID=76867 RepID=A0A0C2Z218_HEBCY|nr:hypothetical protein M413DRAFT_271754 [Hebeloma cylindrosporum h7]
MRLKLRTEALPATPWRVARHSNIPRSPAFSKTPGLSSHWTNQRSTFPAYSVVPRDAPCSTSPWSDAPISYDHGLLYVRSSATSLTSMPSMPLLCEIVPGRVHGWRLSFRRLSRWEGQPFSSFG